MKRNMNLVRNILLNVEQAGPLANIKFNDFGDIDEQTIRAHVELMIDKGLIKGERDRTHYFRLSITWEGYELLDNIRALSRNRKFRKKHGKL